MEALGLLESETPIAKCVNAFLLAIVVKTFILYLISGRTNSSLFSPIMLEHKFSSWEQEDRALALLWPGEKSATYWACGSVLQTLSMQSIVFKPNSDSVQSSVLMIWVDVVTLQDVSVQAKEN